MNHQFLGSPNDQARTRQGRKSQLQGSHLPAFRRVPKCLGVHTPSHRSEYCPRSDKEPFLDTRVSLGAQERTGRGFGSIGMRFQNSEHGLEVFEFFDPVRRDTARGEPGGCEQGRGPSWVGLKRQSDHTTSRLNPRKSKIQESSCENVVWFISYKTSCNQTPGLGSQLGRSLAVKSQASY